MCNPCQVDTTGPGSIAQRGSTAAPLVQRGDSMAGPCRGDCKARQMIQLGAVIGCGSTAWPSRHGTGSTAWERRLAVNPSVGVRRQLPLHKGAFFAARETTGPGSVAGRGSAVWPWRLATAGAQYGRGGSPPRERSLAVPTRDRERSMTAEALRLEKRRKFWYTGENPQKMGKGRIFL